MTATRYVTALIALSILAGTILLIDKYTDSTDIYNSIPARKDSRDRLKRAILKAFSDQCERRANRPYKDWLEEEKMPIRNLQRTAKEINLDLPDIP